MKYWWAILILCSGFQNHKGSEKIFTNQEFSVYSDKVTQGDFEARAISTEHLVSDYKSPATTRFSSTVSFKFALNGDDNEAPSGQDHMLTITPDNGRYISPIIRFGEKDPNHFTDDSAAELLPNDTEVTFRVDIRQVLQEFEDQGYYVNWSGEKIFESSFKGVYIAGGSKPLSWDFDNLAAEPDYLLNDQDGDGIYEGTFIFNPVTEQRQEEQEWKLTHDISSYPGYSSDQILIDALYNMSLDETVMLKEKDGTFRTGAKWDGVWTRDISYSVFLSYAFLDEEFSRKSLMRKVKNNRIIQDTGSGGAWPVSTDRIVWSIAAWEIYLVSGDTEWLENVYDIIRNSVEDDFANHVYDERYGLLKGESSFLDWREQSYPMWMDNVDISQSMNLGTNADFYRSFEIIAEMAKELGDRDQFTKYRKMADGLKESMNTHFWNEESGYYNQYLYGRHYMTASPRFEALGNALCILFDIADDNKKKRIISEAPIVPYGVPTIYPQIPNIPPYHNNGIWPFVQAYWNWAASKSGNEKALNTGLASIIRPAALFLTNKENMVASNGDYEGTQINSDRQLWSVAGNLAMIYRVLLGMNFTTDGITFSPTIPESLKGTRQVSDFKYRNANLTFTVNGFGDRIRSMRINGKEVPDFTIPSDLIGDHEIQIVLSNSFDSEGDVNVTDNTFSPAAPYVLLDDHLLQWDKTSTDHVFRIYHNGEHIYDTSEPEYSLNGVMPGFYQVSVVDDNGVESFLSEPKPYFSKNDKIILEAEYSASADAKFDISDYSGSGAIFTSPKINQTINIPVSVKEKGTYLVSLRYANGTGPWNTDNNCAIRSLTVNDKSIGTLVFPQRGQDEWSNWGYTNQILIELEKGANTIEIAYRPHNSNMDGEINDALIDFLTLKKVIEYQIR